MDDMYTFAKLYIQVQQGRHQPTFSNANTVVPHFLWGSRSKNNPRQVKSTKLVAVSTGVLP